MDKKNIDIIKTCLNKAGLTDLPTNPNQNLSDYGMDSLLMVLTLAEIEKYLNKNIPVTNFNQNNFATINSIIVFLKKENLL